MTEYGIIPSNTFRFAFSLTSCRLQHVMLDSEKDYIKRRMPGNVIQKLRQLKEASLVISPEEIVSQVIFNSAHFNLSSQIHRRN